MNGNDYESVTSFHYEYDTSCSIINPMGRIWENFNSRCKTTMIASKIRGLTNLTRLPSTIFNCQHGCLPSLSLITIKTNMPQMIWLVIYNQVLCIIWFFYCLLLSFNLNSSQVTLTGYNRIELRFVDRSFGFF